MWCILPVWSRCRRFRCETQFALVALSSVGDYEKGFRERLILDNYHRESGLYLVEMAYFPGDDLFQFVHAVSGDLCDDVVDSVDHVGLFDLWNRFQFLDDLVFGPDLGIYENESHRHFWKQPS